MQQATATKEDQDTGINQRIKEAREALDWSQEDLAYRLGVTVETIDEWENGVRDPRSNRIVTLAGILGVSAHWLLDGSGEFGPTDTANPAEAAKAQLDSVRLKLNELKLLLNDIETQLDAL